MHAPAQLPTHQDSAGRLETWKEIAAYLKRDVRTVQRWEKLEGLPVHRHLHAKVATVYAYPHELDRWWSRRQPAVDLPGRNEHRTWMNWAAIAGALVLFGVAVIAAWRLQDQPSPQVAARRLWSGPDVDHLGSVSQDGRWLAITSAGTEDLAKVDLASGTETPLTHKPAKAITGAAFYPVFSHDGSRIAYTWDEGSVLSLRVIGSDGAGERILFRDPGHRFVQALDWSGNGKLVVTAGMTDGSNRLLVVDTATGSQRVVAQLHRTLFLKAALSPDGQWVAIDQEARKGPVPDRDILLFPLNGGPAIPLVTHPDNDWMLGWARDGTLMFACERSGSPDAWMLPVSAGGVARGQPALLLKNLGPVWPLGFDRNKAFYYGLPTAVTDVYVAAIDFDKDKVVAQPVPATTRYTGLNGSPDWSPDGSRLAYVPFRRRMSAWLTARIIVRHQASGADTMLSPALGAIEMLRWSPDGASFIAVGFDLENRHGVFRVDARTGATANLTGVARAGVTYHEPFLSTDGRRVYYKKRRGQSDPSPLMMLDLDSRVEKQLLPSVYRLAVSPDGQRLAYCTFDMDRERIFVVPLAGGPHKEIYSEPRSGRIVSVAWAPGGRHLLYAKQGKLRRVALTGGSPVDMPLAAEALREIRIHPGGARIAFTSGSTARGQLWKVENLLTAPSPNPP